MAHYRLDTRRLTVAETWRLGGAGTFTGFVSVALKLIGLNLGGTKPIGVDIDRLELASLEDLPPDVHDAFGVRSAEAVRLGFERRLAYMAPGVDESTESYAVVFVDAPRHTALTLIFSRTEAKTDIATVFRARLASGDEVCHADQNPTFDTRPGLHGVGLPGAPAEKLLRLHRAWIGDQPVTPLPSDDEALLALIIEENQAWLKYGVHRGFLVPIAPVAQEASSGRSST